MSADMEQLRSDFSTAMDLLLDARNLFDPYGDGRLNEPQSECAEVCKRIDDFLISTKS